MDLAIAQLVRLLGAESGFWALKRLPLVHLKLSNLQSKLHYCWGHLLLLAHSTPNGLLRTPAFLGCVQQYAWGTWCL